MTYHFETSDRQQTRVTPQRQEKYQDPAPAIPDPEPSTEEASLPFCQFDRVAQRKTEELVSKSETHPDELSEASEIETIVSDIDGDGTEVFELHFKRL